MDRYCPSLRGKNRDRKVFAFPPFAAAVVGVPHPAVVSPDQHHSRVGRLHIVERALKTRLRPQAAHNQRAVSLENAVRVFGINDQVREIERSPDHPLAFITFLPCRAAVIGKLDIFSATRQRRKRVASAYPSRPPTSIRFLWKPLLTCSVISVQVLPPSVERNNPLADGAVGIAPPERYSQPFRRKSLHRSKHDIGITRVNFAYCTPGRRSRALGGCCHVLPPTSVCF